MVFQGFLIHKYESELSFSPRYFSEMSFLTFIEKEI